MLGNLKLRDIKPLHIEAVKTAVLKKGRSQKLALNGRLTLHGTKTQASARLVDLGETAMQLLREHRRAEKAKRLKPGMAATCGDGDATIFTNLVGKPMDAGGLKRTWKRIITKANVGHV